MEQMIGTPPYRYEVVGDSEARIVEHRRKGPFRQLGKAEGAHPLGARPSARGHRGHVGGGRGELRRRPDRQGDGQGRQRADESARCRSSGCSPQAPATREPSTATGVSRQGRSRWSRPGQACRTASSPSRATTRLEDARSSPQPRSRLSPSATVSSSKYASPARTRDGSKPTRSSRRRLSRPAKHRPRRRVSPDKAGEWLEPRLCRGLAQVRGETAGCGGLRLSPSGDLAPCGQFSTTALVGKTVVLEQSFIGDGPPFA